MRSLCIFLLCLPCLFYRPSAAGAAEGKLALSVIDAKTQKPVACRIHLTGPNKHLRKIDGAVQWADHYVFPGSIELKLPLGMYTFELERGPEYYNVTGNFEIDRFADDSKQVELRRVVDMSSEGWWSGDMHVRRDVRDLPLVLLADDLHVAEVATWWNSKNDLAGKSYAAKLTKNRMVTFDGDREYELFAGGITRGGTEVLCFHLPGPLTVPADTAEYPSLAQLLAPLRKTPRSSALPEGEGTASWIDATASYGWDLPVLVANGLVDSIEVANGHFGRKAMLPDTKLGKPRDGASYAGPFGYARWSQDIYFKLLECGLRIPPTAGSGSGMFPNPAGYNRVYVHLDGSFNDAQWWKNLKAGQAVVTNGPLLRPRVQNELPGHTLQGEEGKELELEIGLTLTTREPISYLEIIQNGQMQQIRFADYVKEGHLPPLHFKESGWFVLRAVGESGDTYRFAMTAPYYVEFGGKPRISRKAAQYFLDWVYERAKQIHIDDPEQRRAVMEYHRKARDFWKNLVEKANAE